jgi:predicted NAD-dependent protein-ADP-ribosyltransferase YbiA (DUF1768 family)
MDESLYTPSRISGDLTVIVRLRPGLLIATAEEGEESELLSWLGAHAGNVFRVSEIKGGSAFFQSLGPEDEACRTPLNITSDVPAPFNLISNFAHTPFELDGMTYASIEGFWQGLKFPDESDRRRIASLVGAEAKDAGYGAPSSDAAILYQGRTVAVGTWAHWRLMERACFAKFEQNALARDALLSTGSRPLVHQVRRDSRTIPGVIMAQIWMRIRRKLSPDAAQQTS